MDHSIENTTENNTENAIDITLDENIDEKRRHIDLNKPNIFNVPLNIYAFQPWFQKTYLPQWFNYGLTPATWHVYATMQVLHAKKQNESLFSNRNSSLETNRNNVHSSSSQ
jgi:sulfate adenylyltransferase subunit 1 (EFTu-like GTPase family)